MLNDWIWNAFPEQALEVLRVRYCLEAGTCTLASVIFDHWAAALLALALLSAFMLVSALVITGLFVGAIVWLILVASAVVKAMRTILFEMWDAAQDLAAWLRRIVYRV